MIATYQIIATLQQAKASLHKKYGLKSLAIFGSYSINNAVEGKGAIEIMVEFSGPVGMRFMDLEEELEQILDHKVDLVARKSLESKYFKVLKQDMIYI